MSEKDKPLVHLVDDDEAIRHSASFMLRLAGYRVQTHVDGVSFLEKLDGLETGCVLLDVQMPKMNGIAVQKALNEEGCEMPVVVLTGHGDVSVAVQAMKAGAVNFVEKPYEKQVLLKAIEEGFEHLESVHQGALQKAEAEKLLASPFDHRLRGFVENRIPFSKLICHVRPRPQSRRQSRIVSNARCISSFAATSATLM